MRGVSVNTKESLKEIGGSCLALTFSVTCA